MTRHEVRQLLLAYLELQRQIDLHHLDAPSYVLKDLREQQAIIEAQLSDDPQQALEELLESQRED